MIDDESVDADGNDNGDNGAGDGSGDDQSGISMLPGAGQNDRAGGAMGALGEYSGVAGIAASLSVALGSAVALTATGNYANVPAAKVDVNANTRRAYKFFTTECNGRYTSAQAIGIIANLVDESGLNPTAVGDHGLAYGINQAHPDRQADFKRAFGTDMAGSSLDQQLRFVDYELQHNYAGAYAELRTTNDPRVAAAIISRDYERPADTAGSESARAATAGGLVSSLESPPPSTNVASNTPPQRRSAQPLNVALNLSPANAEKPTPAPKSNRVSAARTSAV